MGQPVYLKIAESIKNGIYSGTLKPGDAIDSEHSLSRKFGVSRMTVRKGLIILTNQGFIYSVPGKGSYVKNPDYTRFVINFDEISSIINKADQAKLLDVNIIVPDEKLAESLQISRNKNIIMARRIFYDNGAPFAYDVKYLLHYKGMPIVEKEIHHATLSEVVTKRALQSALNKELVIYAQIPADELKTQLNLQADTAVLVVEQKLLSSENKPMGLGITYFRGDYLVLRGINKNILAESKK